MKWNLFAVLEKASQDRNEVLSQPDFPSQAATDRKLRDDTTEHVPEDQEFAPQQPCSAHLMTGADMAALSPVNRAGACSVLLNLRIGSRY
jgi:hypothetical protein